jgi:putative endonuclease
MSAQDLIVAWLDERIAVGQRGEAAVEQLYVSRGYRVVARNWRCRIGELDLVVARGSTLVICEVKTRRGTRFGGGFEAVDARKRQKLRALAEAFCLQHPGGAASIRFDVASVRLRTDGSAAVEIFDDAF